jgi:hypothetical protein
MRVSDGIDERERERVSERVCVRERESERECVCVREKEKLHARAHTPRMAEPKQRPFARLTLATMLLAKLLTIWFLASQATVCSLHDVGDGAATVEGLSLQEMPRVGNTFINTTGTVQGFIPVASRSLSAAIQEIFNAVTRMASPEPPPVRERERRGVILAGKSH